MRSSIWLSSILCALTLSVGVSAQTVQVFSPFTRIDPFGKPVRVDTGRKAPREVLSPGLPRNATTGLHVVVEGSPGAEFKLYIGLNPEDAVAVKLYRELYSRQGDQWIPDRLQECVLPCSGKIGMDLIEGQTAQAFWLDLRVARNAPVERIKIEPQAGFGDLWARYPMEARILEATAPDVAPATTSVASLESPSDYSARNILKQKLCGNREKVGVKIALTVRDFIARDAAQDLAMASVVPSIELWSVTNASDQQSWCKVNVPNPDGAEWYLRIHDRIIGARQ